MIINTITRIIIDVPDWIHSDKNRGIDYAVANNEVPPKAQDLPLLLKQVTFIIIFFAFFKNV